jgi:hypothetical protein
MFTVHINGVMQIPGIDYTACKNAVAFTTPPQAGYVVHVSNSRGTVGQFYADGSTYLYQMTMDIIDEPENITTLLNDVVKYYNNPAVADMLERLQVVIELIKENG